MTEHFVDWPAADSLGLRSGDGAPLLQITAKAIRVYRTYGLLPEPDRDANRYRRYDARANGPDGQTPRRWTVAACDPPAAGSRYRRRGVTFRVAGLDESLADKTE